MTLIAVISLVAVLCALGVSGSIRDQAETIFFREHASEYTFQSSLEVIRNDVVAERTTWNVRVQNKTVAEYSLVEGTPVISSSERRRCFGVSFEAVFRDMIMEPALFTGAQDFNFSFGYPSKYTFICETVGISASVANTAYHKLATDPVRDHLQSTHISALALWRSLGWKTYSFRMVKSCKPFCSGNKDPSYWVNVRHDSVVSALDELTGEPVDLVTSTVRFKTVEHYFMEAQFAIDFAVTSTLRLDYDPQKGYPTLLSYHAPRDEVGNSHYDSDFVQLSDASPMLHALPTPLEFKWIVVIILTIAVVLALVIFLTFKYWLLRKTARRRIEEEENDAASDDAELQGDPNTSGEEP